MTALPASPFMNPAASDAVAATAAAHPASPTVAAAVPIELDEHRFVLDEVAFWEAIEPLPIFLAR